MISAEYDFQSPKTLDDALSLLSVHRDDASLLSGGMSLVPIMTLGLIQPDVVISLNHLPELEYVREDGDDLRIGALTRHYAIMMDPLVHQHAPLLAEAASKIGDVQIRNRGSIGGSLAHADPAADYLPVTRALSARVCLQRQGSERYVEVSDFFRGLMMTAREPDELLTEVVIPKSTPGCSSSYQRLSRVEGNYAIVAAAGIVEPRFEGARIGLGGVAPEPVLIDVGVHLQAGLTDAGLEAVGQDAYDASSEAHGDLNGDANYRREMARVFAIRVIQSAAESV